MSCKRVAINVLEPWMHVHQSLGIAVLVGVDTSVASRGAIGVALQTWSAIAVNVRAGGQIHHCVAAQVALRALSVRHLA